MLVCGIGIEVELAMRWPRGLEGQPRDVVLVMSCPEDDCKERFEFDRDVFGRRRCWLPAEIAESRLEFSVLDMDLTEAAVCVRDESPSMVADSSLYDRSM